MPRKRPHPAALVLVALAWVGLPAIVARMPYRPREALPVRWLRKLAEHPLRAAWATGLVLFALRRGPGKPRQGTSEADPGHSEAPGAPSDGIR